MMIKMAYSVVFIVAGTVIYRIYLWFTLIFGCCRYLRIKSLENFYFINFFFLKTTRPKQKIWRKKRKVKLKKEEPTSIWLL